MMLTAAIAVAFGFGRVWLQSQRPWELDRALSACDNLRVEYPSRAADGAETTIRFEIARREEVQRIRTLLDLSSAREVPPGNVILGGPSIEITLLQDGSETTRFHLIDSLLISAAQGTTRSREFGLASDDAWCAILEIGQSHSETRRGSGRH
jgi:hypothetical protein